MSNCIQRISQFNAYYFSWDFYYGASYFPWKNNRTFKLLMNSTNMVSLNIPI